MKLASANGNSITLSIARYQFPAETGSGDDDWDANWLTVSGKVTDGGRHWSFQEPCLTTWEARELADWLHGVVSGSVVAAPYEPDNESTLQEFTEPNLALNLASRTGSDLVLRVYLSLESRPPESTDAAIFEYYVELAMTDRELASALAEWETELRAFPVRPA